MGGVLDLIALYIKDMIMTFGWVCFVFILKITSKNHVIGYKVN